MPESLPVPELPEPSAALVLILALTDAHLRTMPKKKRDEFLLSVSHSLGIQEAAHNVTRFRPRAQDPEVLAAMRQARSWWRSAIGVLVTTERVGR